MVVYPPPPGYEYLGPTTSDDYEQPPFKEGQYVLHAGRWWRVRTQVGDFVSMVALSDGANAGEHTVPVSSVRGSWRRR